MAAAVQAEGTFSRRGERVLIESAQVAFWGWDVQPRGDRFLITRFGEGEKTVGEARFRVVINWFDELREAGLLGEGR